MLWTPNVDVELVFGQRREAEWTRIPEHEQTPQQQGEWRAHGQRINALALDGVREPEEASGADSSWTRRSPVIPSNRHLRDPTWRLERGRSEPGPPGPGARPRWTAPVPETVGPRIVYSA